MKRTLLICFTLILCSSIFFACGKSTSSSGSKPVVSISTLDRGQVPAAEGDYASNRWVEWINENAPVQVEIVPVNRGDSRNLLTAMFAAGTAPDLVWEFNKVTLDMYYDQGVIQPVGDLISQYSTNYKAYLQRNPDLVPYLTGPDGKQYGMSSRRTVQGLANQTIFVRKDWLDRFGMGIPSTMDQALNFMRTARDTNASGDPQGTWGIGTDRNWALITTAMFGKPSGDFNVVNGHFVDWFSTPAYRESLAFLRQVYEEELIDPEYVTDDNNARQNQFMVTGRIAMRFMGMGQEAQFRDLMANVPTADYVSIPPLQTSQGRFGYGQEVVFDKMVLMNSSARNPRACIEYMDWMIGSTPTNGGWWTLTYGLEGRHYRSVNGVPQVIDQNINNVELVYTGEYGVVYDSPMTADWIPVRAASDPISQSWAVRYAQAINNTINTQYLRYVPYEPAIQRVTDFNSAISSQVSAITTDIMMGRVSVDQGLQQINDFKRAQGWDEVIALQDAWYQANRHLFGQ